VTTESGTLFVVATPIGHLGDITLRAIDTLRECDGVLAEDTRRTRQLLTHLGIAGKRLDRLDMHATEQAIAHVLRRLDEGEKLALVTDAGTPTVSDPGSALVSAAASRGVRVVPLPGPSAALCALSASGFGGDGRFRFLGFLPRDGKKRREALQSVAETPEVAIIFEAPGRVRGTLTDLAEIAPERMACVARELTKVHEELVRGTSRELASLEREWIGEIVILLDCYAPDDRAARVGDDELDARIDAALDSGEPSRLIAEKLAMVSGRPRKDVYDRILSRKRRG